MKKLESIQGRKIMSSYGGPGSIIETKDNGSLIIKNYDSWTCFIGRNLQNARIFPINDRRLLEHLQHNYSRNIRSILPIPEADDDTSLYYPKNRDLSKTIKSDYFPRWFFCPRCRRLHTLDEWRNMWENEFPNDNKFNDNYPACYNCSSIQNGNNNRIYRRSLEQIRFCMASQDSGKLCDIPFKKLFANNFTYNQACCDLRNIDNANVDLTYHTSSTSDGLQSISIKTSDGNRRNMASIKNPYILTNEGAFKLVIRNQNNIYYPKAIRSLYIPQDDALIQYTQQILNGNANGHTEDEILQNLRAFGINSITLHDIHTIITNSRLNYDEQEYYYITDDDNYRFGINQSQDGDFYAKRYTHLTAPFVKRLYAILTLKETSVIPSFTRIAPEGTESTWWNINTGQEDSRAVPYVVNTFNDYTDYIPGVESYGEGIFLEIAVDNIPTDERETFVHTFSHIIMKELEYQCGYPLSSIKEKIYKRNNGTQYGILIYTIGGSEGSYGGLVSLLPDDPDAESGGKLVHLIENALERVKDCPNDPICMADEGHCFACVDIPEISCCKFNLDLHRGIVIKNDNNRHNSKTTNITSSKHTSQSSIDDDDDVVLA